MIVDETLNLRSNSHIKEAVTFFTKFFSDGRNCKDLIKAICRIDSELGDRLADELGYVNIRPGVAQVHIHHVKRDEMIAAKGKLENPLLEKEYIGFVNALTPQHAWMKSQNITTSWNNGVRSTHIGDFLQFPEAYYMVKGEGFKIILG